MKKPRQGLRLLLLTSLVLLIACSSTSRPAAAPPTIPTNINELVKQYYSEVHWRLPSAGFEFTYLYDRPTFLGEHREEMLRTLEIPETIEMDDMAVSFVRYSIGANMYREAVWLRKVNGKWRVSLKQYFSEYSQDPGADWKSEKTKAVLKRVSDWQEGSKAWW